MFFFSTEQNVVNRRKLKPKYVFKSWPNGLMKLNLICELSDFMLWRWQELWREVLTLSKYRHIINEEGINISLCLHARSYFVLVFKRQAASCQTPILGLKNCSLRSVYPTMSLYTNILTTLLLMSILFASSWSGSSSNRTKISGKNGRYFSHVIK